MKKTKDGTGASNAIRLIGTRNSLLAASVPLAILPPGALAAPGGVAFTLLVLLGLPLSGRILLAVGLSRGCTATRTISLTIASGSHCRRSERQGQHPDAHGFPEVGHSPSLLSVKSNLRPVVRPDALTRSTAHDRPHFIQSRERSMANAVHSRLPLVERAGPPIPAEENQSAK